MFFLKLFMGTFRFKTEETTVSFLYIKLSLSSIEDQGEHSPLGWHLIVCSFFFLYVSLQGTNLLGRDCITENSRGWLIRSTEVANSISLFGEGLPSSLSSHIPGDHSCTPCRESGRVAYTFSVDPTCPTKRLTFPLRHYFFY